MLFVHWVQLFVHRSRLVFESNAKSFAIGHGVSNVVGSMVCVHVAVGLWVGALGCRSMLNEWLHGFARATRCGVVFVLVPSATRGPKPYNFLHTTHFDNITVLELYGFNGIMWSS